MSLEISKENFSKALIIGAISLKLVLWASAFSAIQVSLTGYTPAEVAFLRYLAASIVLLVYALISRMPMPQLKDLPLIALCGAIGIALYNFMLNTGELTVSAGVSGFINSLQIAVTALLSVLFLNERLKKVGWIGIALCIVGVGIISFSNGNVSHLSIESEGDVPYLSIGVLFVFISTLSTSLYSVLQKPLLKKYTVIQFITYAIWAGAIVLFFLAPNAVLSVTHAPVNSTLAIVYLGLFPGILAYVAWSYVLSKLPASQAGSYLALIPVVSTFIAWLWLGEVPTPFFLLGGGIIFYGVRLINQNKVAQQSIPDEYVDNEETSKILVNQGKAVPQSVADEDIDRDEKSTVSPL